MTQHPPKISQALAEFVADTQFSQLSEPALKMTRYALLDQLGVSLAATGLADACAPFTQLVVDQQSRPESRLLAVPGKASAAQAAFANGALSHALDFEDAHDAALVHPNAATIPAALAVAEAKGDVSGRELLVAIAVGCEVVCRLALALRVPLDDYGWYPPPILSAYGATAAVARLYQLTPQQILDAFSLTLSQATCSAEIKYNPASEIRAVRDAFPAKAGIVSAQLAMAGVSGFAEPFEGKAGFFAGFARGQYAADVLLQGLGERFEIANLSFKPWPSCRGTHAFIEAALTLTAQLRQQGIAPERIARVDTYGHRINRMLAEPLSSKRRPQTAIDAKFSIPFCVANAIHHDKVELSQFTAKGLDLAPVLRLAGRVHFHVDDTLDQLHQVTQGRTVITLDDGGQFSEQITDVYGCPARPLSETAMVEKFINCCGYAAIPVKAPDKLAETLLSLERIDDLRAHLFANL